MPDIPLLPDAAIDPLAKQPLQRAQQELRRLLGFGGDVLDMAVTYRAMLDAGLITLSSLENIRPGSGVPPRAITIAAGTGTQGPPGPTGPPGAGAEEPDLTPPPNVTGLSASPGITRVIVTWDLAGYTVGHGPGQVNLYAVLRQPGDPLPTFGDAVLFYSAPHPLMIAALAVEPNTRIHLWAKHQTVDGIESPDPTGGTNGVTVTTGQDVSQLMAVLAGQITSSALHAALASRIDLIDGSGPGSVNARVLSEANARTSADSANATSISGVSARLNSGGDTYSAIVLAQATANTANATANGAASDVTGLLAQYTVKLDVNGYTAGFGLSSTPVDGVPFSDFQIRSDRFSITNPNATQVSIVSLTRSGTTATLNTATSHGLFAGDSFGIRGVSNDGNWNRAWTVLSRPSATQITFTVPNTLATPAVVTAAKLATTSVPFIVDNGVVYMNIAMIKDGEITNAKIGLLAVDNANIAKVSADKLTAGSLWVGGRITGGNFTGWAWPSAGGTGFYIGPEGLLLGNANDGRYLQVTSAGNIYAPGFEIVNGSASFSGALNAATGTFAGNLSAAGGTFAGNLSAAGGTFTGTMSAASITTGTLNLDRIADYALTQVKIDRTFAENQVSPGQTWAGFLTCTMTPPAGNWTGSVDTILNVRRYQPGQQTSAMSVSLDYWNGSSWVVARTSYHIFPNIAGQGWGDATMSVTVPWELYPYAAWRLTVTGGTGSSGNTGVSGVLRLTSYTK